MGSVVSNCQDITEKDGINQSYDKNNNLLYRVQGPKMDIWNKEINSETKSKYKDYVPRKNNNNSVINQSQYSVVRLGLCLVQPAEWNENEQYPNEMTQTPMMIMPNQ